MTLLDTDTLTLLMHGQERIVRRVAEADAITITIVTRIEILRGRFDSILKAANAAELLKAQHWLSENETYLNELELAMFDVQAAAEFDNLRRNTKLKKMGRADMLIASIALARRAILVTRNFKHYRLVPGLSIENWAD
jgi:tRNA(fMet)-specific endonuclease VapC